MVSYLMYQKEELIWASKKILKRWLEDVKLLALWKFLYLLLSIIFSNNPSQYLQFVFPTTGFLIWICDANQLSEFLYFCSKINIKTCKKYSQTFLSFHSVKMLLRYKKKFSRILGTSKVILYRASSAWRNIIFAIFFR